MSALELKRRKGGVLGSCQSGCVRKHHRTVETPKTATHEAYLLGYPAACLCDDCVKLWRETFGVAA